MRLEELSAEHGFVIDDDKAKKVQARGKARP